MDWTSCQKEQADVLGSGSAIALNEVDPQRVLDNFQSETASNLKVTASPLKANRILPFAAEKYDINPNLKNYVVVPVVIMPSDLPNKNYVGFPFKALSDFNPGLGMLSYETWRNQPTHYEHQNSDILQAKGMVLDVGMTPMRGTNGDLWKVHALCAFDREKDPILANSILNRERTSYSMGAYISHYECSICGASTQNKLKPSCGSNTS